jgi:nardilysin
MYLRVIKLVILNSLDCNFEYFLLQLMLEETVFDTLRTKEQLGYDVSCTDSITRGILNFSITVHSQEDKHS